MNIFQWQTGNWSSRRVDGGSFLEKGANGWLVYDTDEEGGIKVQSSDPVLFAPRVAGPFKDLELAQKWSEKNQPQRPA